MALWSELYVDDALLEFPQGGERIRGKANIVAFRTASPARFTFDLRRTVGAGDVWVNEGGSATTASVPTTSWGSWNGAAPRSSARPSTSGSPSDS
jgi:hypothetical protein